MQIAWDVNGLPVSSVLIGAGVWVMFALWWSELAGLGVERGWRLASFGVLMASGLVGGAVLGRVMGGGVSTAGAVLGGGAVVALSLWKEQAHRARAWDVAGAAMVAGFAGLAIARVGCVGAGCDFGNVLHGDAWLIQRHARGTPAWFDQVQQGLIDAGAPWSLPTYPFAPVMVALFAAGALAGWGVRRWAGGEHPALWWVGVFTLWGAALNEGARATSIVVSGPAGAPAMLWIYGIAGAITALVALWRWRNWRRLHRMGQP
ncbi:hypothetical protein DL240_05175 [Lujinxingia litoralis]|uniref:Diacylglyceryl transferase n=1 Tax=Lujinxingia litoralis TaxID=2211119 RepID=A0A328C6T8_9DELT|nr:hypothetical protein [Lujinxingia litoralis]RAL23553.1 hypothetical protein DL240_05175 [Lujinxingia litoralis]